MLSIIDKDSGQELINKVREFIESEKCKIIPRGGGK
jgi:hypothetical protein